MTKFFKFIATIQIEANDQKEADEIIQKNKN